MLASLALPPAGLVLFYGMAQYGHRIVETWLGRSTRAPHGWFLFGAVSCMSLVGALLAKPHGWSLPARLGPFVVVAFVAAYALAWGWWGALRRLRRPSAGPPSP